MRRLSVLALGRLETTNWWRAEGLVNCPHMPLLPDLAVERGQAFLRPALKPHFLTYQDEKLVTINDKGEAVAIGALLRLERPALFRVAQVALRAQIKDTWKGLAFGPLCQNLMFANQRYWPQGNWPAITQWLRSTPRTVWTQCLGYMWERKNVPTRYDPDPIVATWLGLHYHGGSKPASQNRITAWRTTLAALEN